MWLVISFNLNCDNLPYVGVNHNHTTEARQRRCVVVVYHVTIVAFGHGLLKKF